MSKFSPMERADAFLRSGELDDVLQALNDQLEQQPDDEAARRLRAAVRFRLPLAGDDADSALRAALADLDALVARTVEDVLLRCQLLMKLGRESEAFALLTAAVTGDDPVGRDPRVIELLLDRLYQRGDSSTAIDLLFELPKTWRWLRWIGDFHALKGDIRVALDYYCSALDALEETTQDAAPPAVGFIGNLRGQILIRRAEMYERLALYSEAEIDLEEAEKLIPGDAMIAFRHGLVVFLTGDTERGASLCAAALASAKPDSLRAELITLIQNEPRFAPLTRLIHA